MSDTRYPQMAPDDPDDPLDEFLARAELGDPVVPEDYRDRFADARDYESFLGRAHALLALTRLQEGWEGPLQLPAELAGSKAARRGFERMVEMHGILDQALNPEELAGTLFKGRYLLRDRLGRGGFGVVYRASDRNLPTEAEPEGRSVAVKILKFSGSSANEDAAASIRRESQLLAALNVPTIVTVFDAGPDFLVMEYVPGRTLHKALEELAGRQVPERQRARSLGREEDAAWPRRVVELLLPVVRAVAAAHGAGIVHRDIKPENVMIDDGGRPRLLDFGVGVRRGLLPASAGRSPLLGTIPYMPPEAIQRGSVNDDPRGDVYQLGLLLYETLVLRPAFAIQPGSDLEEACRSITESGPPPLAQVDRSVPQELAAIVQRAAARDLEERTPTARELAENLDRFLRHLPPRGVGLVWWRVLLGYLRFGVRQSAVWGLAAGLALVGVLRALSSEDWVPPEIYPARIESGSRALPLNSMDFLELGNTLGLQIDSEDEYELEVFALHLEGERFLVEPLDPSSFRESPRSGATSLLDVEPGHSVVGLWAIAWSPDRADLGEYMRLLREEVQRMHRTESASLAKVQERARSLFDQSRSARPWIVDPELLQEHPDRFLSAAGLHSMRFFFPVR